MRVLRFFVYMLLVLFVATSAFANKSKHRNNINLLTYEQAVETYHNGSESDMFEHLHKAMLGHVTFCKLRENEEVIYLKSCRNSKFGCEERIKKLAELILSFSLKYDVDPYLVAGIAYYESRFNPFAVSPKNAKGIMQVNPRNRNAKPHPFLRNKKYWASCRNKLGNCQDEVLEPALKIFLGSYEKCGHDVALALSMYNSGKCDLRRKYVRGVLNSYRSLLTYDGANYLRYCDLVKTPYIFPERKRKNF